MKALSSIAIDLLMLAIAIGIAGACWRHGTTKVKGGDEQ